MLDPSDFAYDDEQRHSNDHGPEPEPSTLHERIAAAVAEARQHATDLTSVGVWGTADPGLILAACDHADNVLARHRSVSLVGYRGRCLCAAEDPCPEVRDLADLWLGKG